MKSKLNAFFTKNLMWKVISVVLAVSAWILLSNTQDPYLNRTVNVPVTYLNQDKLLSQEDLFVISAPETVQLTVYVRQSKTSQVKPELFTCTADLIDHNGGELGSQRVHITVTQVSGFDIVRDWSYYKNDPNITVSMDDYIEKNFKIQLLKEDDLSDGLILANTVTFYPESVTVKGPSSSFSNVSSVKAVVNLKELSAEGYGVVEKTVDLHLYDANGSIISNSNGFLTMNRETALMTATIYRTDIARVVLEGFSGTPADGYRYVSYSVDRSDVAIQGLKSSTAEYNEIVIPADIIDISGITEDTVYSVNLSDLLPEGILLAEDDPVVNVTIHIEKLEVRNFTISKNQIRVINISEDYESAVLSDVILQVSGFKEDLDVFTTDSLTATVDMSGYTSGTYRVPVSISLVNGYTFENAEALFTSVQLTYVAESSEEETEESSEEESESGSSSEDSTEESSEESSTESSSESSSEAPSSSSEAASSSATTEETASSSDSTEAPSSSDVSSSEESTESTAASEEASDEETDTEETEDTEEVVPSAG